jgi:hypothetical protein
MAVLRSIGPALRCSFSRALALADATVGDADGRCEAYTVGPELPDPWPVPLTAPAMLLPSTHNHHLYLGAQLTYERYVQLLRVLASEGLLESGYVSASESRGQTRLRLPWIRKAEQAATVEAPF